MRPENLAEAIRRWLGEQVGAAGARGLVLGISGGLDSAVAAALCRRAVGRGSILGLIMPCQSLPEDIDDARLVAAHLGLETEEIDLSPVCGGLLELLPAATGLPPGNLKPRLRMLTLYYFANLRHYLVVGTGNRSEAYVGYFTKYGDGGVDIAPLGGILKTEVVELAGHLEIPRKIIEKTPSAGLWPGQTDEGELGLAYGDIDAFIKAGDQGLRPDLPPEVVRRIEELHRTSEHKRAPLPAFFPGR